MNRSRARQPTTASQSGQAATATGTGAQRSAAGGGKGARRPNLPFRFHASALDGVLRNDPTVDVKATLHDKTQRELKDGDQFTDSERLFLVVQKLKLHGYPATRIAQIVEGAFFNVGSQAQGRDRVDTVTLTGTEVHVTFRSPGGYALNQGSILPMICTAPTVYTGQDTNARGSTVRNFQATGELPRNGSWLSRNAALIEQAFLNSRWGTAFRDMSPSLRQNDTNYIVAVRAYEEDLSRDYIGKATFWVKQTLGPPAGRTPQALLQAAITLAMSYTNPNLCATAHTTLELQDEAVAQKVMEALGYSANVDTDNVAASTAF